MQKSQVELLGLIGAVIASALGFLLPAQFGWITGIAGFVLVAVLFAYDEAEYRSAFQSVAFSGACGLGVTLIADAFYRWLGSRGEIHMTGDRIETEWLPLTWVCVTAAICAIDRVRMLGRGGAPKRPLGTVQRGFIPQYAAPVSEPTPAPAAEPVSAPAATYRAASVTAPIVAETPATPPVAAPAPVAAAAIPVAVALPAGKETEIYVGLIGEGLNLMRTVKAEHVGRDFYKITEAMPEGETWEFGPGQVVRCKKRNLSTGKGWVAVEEAPRAS
ncbi:MAG: hypothetical protein JO340_04015 [Acidobacteriaceae bacterium]|nr:hypothetical protein [Acidobacteriaceae bacterium]